MLKLVLGAMIAVGLSVGLAIAEDKKETKKEAKPLLGAYERSADPLKLKMTFKKDGKLDFFVDANGASATLICKYTVKDGVYKCTLEDFKTEGDFPVKKEKGYEFSMKIEVKEGSIVVSKFEGAEVDDEAKKAIEGEYSRKSD